MLAADAVQEVGTGHPGTAPLFREFGFTPEAVLAHAKDFLDAAGAPAAGSTESSPDQLEHAGADTGTANA
jgi:hypothetical protein